jgi:hypothetical protein
MTVEKFLETMQKYYNCEYNETQYRMIEMYLSEKSASYIRHLFSVILKNHSGQYKFTPDIAIFEKYKNMTLDKVDAEYGEKMQLQNQLRIESKNEKMNPEEMKKAMEFWDNLKKKTKNT